MLIHKDIIVRIVLSFLFVVVTVVFLAPFFYQLLKNKFQNQFTRNHDIDTMIKNQQEKLRGQYGLGPGLSEAFQPKAEMTSSTATNSVTAATASAAYSLEIKDIMKEVQWGGGLFSKNIQNEIAKNYSYKVADSKINSLILLFLKKNYFSFLTQKHQTSKEALHNFMLSLHLFYLAIDEIRQKQFFILEKMAKKCETPTMELALAFQIKLSMAMLKTLKMKIKEEMIYSDHLNLNHYSDDSINLGLEAICKNEANLWAKGPSFIFEELTLALTYAKILAPLPLIKNKNDLNTALDIIGVSREQGIDEIKKKYKKIALEKHPDIIVSLKLPKTLEKIGIQRFNQIQEAYEIIVAHKI